MLPSSDNRFSFPRLRVKESSPADGITLKRGTLTENIFYRIGSGVLTLLEKSINFYFFWYECISSRLGHPISICSCEVGRCNHTGELTRNISPFPLQEPHVNETFPFYCLLKEVRESKWDFTIQLAEICLIWNILFQNSNSSSALTIDDCKVHLFHLSLARVFVQRSEKFWHATNQRKPQFGCHHVDKHLIFALDSLISESQYLYP